MQIKVIGLRCARVEQVLINARAAASEFGSKLKILWVNDPYKITKMGNVLTPTILVNEKVKSSGRIPSVYEFTTWIEEGLTQGSKEKFLEGGVAA